MKLEDILKSKGIEADVISSVLEEMKQNKIYTSSEENIDLRYGKLKTEHEALVNKDTESQKLIAELQKATKGNDSIQAKLTEYETKIAEQEAELQRTKIESAVKVALLNAKAVDVDYLTFKIKEKGELKLDDAGNIKGIDDMLAGLKVQFPNQFESSVIKKYEEHKLPDEQQEKNEMKITAEEFNKMGYNSRVKLREENPDLYNILTKG